MVVLGDATDYPAMEGDAMTDRPTLIRLAAQEQQERERRDLARQIYPLTIAEYASLSGELSAMRLRQKPRGLWEGEPWPFLSK